MGKHRGKVLCIAVTRAMYDDIVTLTRHNGLRNTSETVRACVALCARAAKEAPTRKHTDGEHIADAFDRLAEWERLKHK